MTEQSNRQFAGSTPVETRLEAALPVGTTVLTLDGALPVEALYPGDRIITRNGGAQRLKAIIRRKVPADLRMVRIGRDALGGKPEDEIVLLPHQRILIRDWRAQVLWGAPQARVAAARLIDGEYVTWAETKPAELVSLHFARQEIIYAAGLELLSANPHFAPGFGAQ